MDILQSFWLEDLSSLNDIKKWGIINEEEYEYYKKIRKEQIFSENFIKEIPKNKTEESSIFDNVDIFDYLDKLVEGDHDFIDNEIKKLNKTDLHIVIDNYNWDNGDEIPLAVLKNENCDMTLAMEIFNLADGHYFLKEYYLKNKEPSTYNKDWYDMCLKLLEDMGSGRYPIEDYYNDFSYGIKIALRKKGMNNVLTQDYLL